jgi:hypothetical protein
VQAPTKYELVVNLKAAKALGLDVAPTAHAAIMLERIFRMVTPLLGLSPERYK